MRCNFELSTEGVLYNKSKTELIRYPEGKLSLSFVIPDSVTIIGSYAFYACESITKILIPNSLTSIGEYALVDCTSLQDIVVDSNNVNYSSVIGVLYNKNKTELICYPAGKTNSSFIIPDSVTSIGNYAFYACESITRILIPNSVTSIGDWAFSDCTGLTSVTIPDNVTSIGNGAFSNCTSLKDVYYDGSNKDDITIENGNEYLIIATWQYNQTMPGTNLEPSDSTEPAEPTQPDNPVQPSEPSVFETIISAISNFFTTVGNTISSIFASIIAFFSNLF